jgi:hypothetical protein
MQPNRLSGDFERRIFLNPDIEFATIFGKKIPAAAAHIHKITRRDYAR